MIKYRNGFNGRKRIKRKKILNFVEFWSNQLKNRMNEASKLYVWPEIKISVDPAEPGGDRTVINHSFWNTSSKDGEEVKLIEDAQDKIINGNPNATRRKISDVKNEIKTSFEIKFEEAEKSAINQVSKDCEELMGTSFFLSGQNDT